VENLVAHEGKDVHVGLICVPRPKEYDFPSPYLNPDPLLYFGRGESQFFRGSGELFFVDLEDPVVGREAP